MYSTYGKDEKLSNIFEKQKGGEHFDECEDAINVRILLILTWHEEQ
jgi:hypothetical protein